MEYTLKNIVVNDIIDVINSDRNNATPIMYMDFNVINTMYDSELTISSSDKILYHDSTAIYLCLKYLYKIKVKRNVSTDLLYELLIELNKKRSKIFLFGDSNICIMNASHVIKNNYNQLLVKGIANGYNFNTEDVCKKINSKNVDVLFVGLGVERQEKWILQNYKNINTKVIISVGGWFQYLDGNKLRAPKLIRKMYLEWLFKLIVEFRRVWKRYIFGIPKFYYRVLTKKIILRIEQ